MKQQIFTIHCHGQCVEWVDNHLLVIEHNHNYTSTFVLVLFHKTGGGERASCSKAVRREKRGRKPEKRKERLPAQPEPMKYALAWQRKNTIGWCVKRWQQNVNNRNHWQADDGRTTAKHSEALEALISGLDVIAILPTGFGKSLIFQLLCEIKLATNPNRCILVVAQLNSIVEDLISVKWGWGLHDSHVSWNLYICHFLFGLSTFYVASILFIKGTSCCVLRSCCGIF